MQTFVKINVCIEHEIKIWTWAFLTAGIDAGIAGIDVAWLPKLDHNRWRVSYLVLSFSGPSSLEPGHYAGEVANSSTKIIEDSQNQAP